MQFQRQTQFPAMLTCGIALLSIPFISFAFATIQLWCNHSVTWIAAAIAYCCAIAIARQASYRHTMAVAAIPIAAALLQMSTLDITYDSLLYHSPFITEFMQGWNPIYDFFHGVYGSGEHSVWTLHYAHFLELSATPIALTFGNVEAGKSVNIILLAATFCITAGTLRCIGHKSNALAFIFAFNPVSIAQLFTSLNDYVVYDVIIIMCCMTLLIYTRQHIKIAYAVYCAAVIIGITCKFNHCCYTAVTAAILITTLWLKNCRKESGKLVALSTASAVIAIIFFGFSPYVINLFTTGNPLYPLFDSSYRIIETEINPVETVGMTRLGRFLYALFAQSFSIKATWLIGSDCRIGAFGSFFWIMILLSAACMIFNKVGWNAWIAWLLPSAIALCFPQGWWMRYMPFVWVTIGIGFLWGYNKDFRRNKAMLYTCAGLVCITNLLIIGRGYNNNLQGKLWIDAICDAAGNEPLAVEISHNQTHLLYVFQERNIQLSPIVLSNISELNECETLWAICGQSQSFNAGDDRTLVKLSAAQSARFNPPAYCKPERRRYDLGAPYAQPASE